MSFLSCLGMFYYMLGNLRPELRATQRSVQLIARVTNSNLVKYGFEPILKPFIDDVKNFQRYVFVGRYMTCTISLYIYIRLI